MASIPGHSALHFKAELIRITGTVQGVGYRPFVWRLAQQLNLRGQVWNDGEGVVIQAWGSGNSLTTFRQRLKSAAPPLAQVEAIHVTPLFDMKLDMEPDMDIPVDFSIVESRQSKVLTNISPDAATCPQCLADINDPKNRRYRYPFTNCTHCGPRLSIVNAIPYDRGNTSMSCFPMCPECQAEYDNPANRRFHAQPNACKTCGPSLWLENSQGERQSNQESIDDIETAARLIERGYILAIKGIGGFHLCCDATNTQAVKQLRQRKRRYHKPFALMARDVDVIRQYTKVSREEAKLLQEPAAPIVILRALVNSNLPEDIAPGQTQLGFMLPYTPLHALLLQGIDTPLVMTSGNRSDEAQCITNEQAKGQMHDIADYFLFHDRDIVNRLDDSVARIVNRKPQLLRRARGYAPQPLQLPQGFEQSPQVLAMGAELKNTFCLVKDGKAIVSQHQGDLEDASVFYDYRRNIGLYQQLYDHQPKIIAVDQHPEYISTKLGLEMAASEKLKLIKVQHHHAHITACMAEHGLPLDSKPVLGIALDGLGYSGGSENFGPENYGSENYGSENYGSENKGELWGGEFLLADYRGCQRLACFEPVAMPGGSRAMVEPWRNTYAHLQQALGWEQVAAQYPNLAFVQFMRKKPIDNLATMMAKGINSPLASSTGRLFDAVAALLGLCCESVSYEGQAAMQLESRAENTFAASKPYPFYVDSETCVNSKTGEGMLIIKWQQLWQGLLASVSAQEPIDVIAGRFHYTLVQVIANVVKRLLQHHHISGIVLSGGVMQNKLLLEGLLKELTKQKITIYTPHQIPSNDGGIAFGQAVVAIAQTMTGKAG